MREAVFTIIDAAPSKGGNIFAVVLGLWGVGDPSSFQRVWGAVMTPENIRIASVIALLLCASYWVLWWWLKPTIEARPAMAGDQFTHFGSGHQIKADKVTLGAPQRFLSDAGADVFTDQLKVLPRDRTWEVEYQQGDREAARLAREILNFMKDENIPVRDRFVVSTIYPEQYGVQLDIEGRRIIVGHFPESP